MKVILLQDIRGIGRRFEIKDVPQGHALNFLIPRKMAERATAEKVRQLQQRTERATEEANAAGQRFKEALQKLKEMKIEMAADANEKGKLFESVKAENIGEQLAKEGIMISPEQVVIESPIKEVGKHEVGLRSGETEGAFILTVTAR